MILEKIVSGGQSGADRAALDVSMQLGIPCGGWCPKGRKAEDGKIDPKFPLVETPSADYEERTEWNVRDSDATLILTFGQPTGGTAYTVEMAVKNEKKFRTVDFETEENPKSIRNWIRETGIKVLNVAGPQQSKEPRIYEKTITFLKSVITEDD